MDDYKSCNMKIVSICEKMCDTPLIKIRTNYAFDITELVDELAKYMDSVLDKLIAYYREIINTWF